MTDSDTEQTDTPMWMVVTLKSGTQIRVRVTKYTTKTHPMTDDLTGLKWTRDGSDTGVTGIPYLNLNDVAAVHTEYGAA